MLITGDGIQLTVRDDGPDFDVSALREAETRRGIRLILICWTKQPSTPRVTNWR